MRSIFFLLTLVLCRSSLAFASGEDGGKNPESKGRDLKILSYNIYMLPPLVPMKGRVERAHGIVDTLISSDMDIIVFQEAFHKGAVKVIREGLRATYPYMYGPFNPSHSPFRVSSGVFIISKIALDLKGTIEYKIEKEADKVAKKGAALLEGTWNGKKFQILGTHLQAQNHPDIRKLQVIHLHDSLLCKYRVENVPQIICGDMNTEVEIAKNYCDMLSCLDAEDGDTDGIQKMTYDGTNNELALSVWKRAKTTLDYILLRRNGANANLINRHVGMFKRQWRKGRHDLSDHYAIICEMKL